MVDEVVGKDSARSHERLLAAATSISERGEAWVKLVGTVVGGFGDVVGEDSDFGSHERLKTGRDLGGWSEHASWLERWLVVREVVGA